MKTCNFIILFVFLALSSCTGQTSKKYESISPEAFAEKINTTQNPQIIDVRSPEEFSGQHIDNAVNINWNSNDFVSKASSYDKKKPVFVYCLSGGRSKQASQKLSEMGFSNIYELQGGIMKWNAAGLSKPSNEIIGMRGEEFNELLNTDKKVLVNFYADWCAPCKKMAPYIKKMQKDLAPNITIIRLNADEHKTLVSEMKINELPTLLLYEDKEIKWKHLGFISEENLKKQL